MDDSQLIANSKNQERILYCRRVAKLLQVPIDELFVCNLNIIMKNDFATESDTRKAIYRSSKKITSIGLTDELPVIIHSGGAYAKKTGCRPQTGLTLFEHLPTQRQYVVCESMDTNGFNNATIICNKCDTFSIIKSLRELVNKICNDCHEERIPILPKDILDTVINNSIGVIQNQKKLDIYGVKAIYGMLFNGKAGNGKTMLCRHIKSLAQSHHILCIHRTASQIEKAFQDNSLNELFYSRDADAIIFFDDIDISYLNRQSGNGKIACSILSALDGMEAIRKHGTIRIFTTNEDTDSMDEAFVRPGRIDKILTFYPPDTSMRLRLVSEWHKNILDNIDVDQLVAKTEGKSFAQLNAIKTTLVMKNITDNIWDMTGAIQAAESHNKVNTPNVGFAVKN